MVQVGGRPPATEPKVLGRAWASRLLEAGDFAQKQLQQALRPEGRTF
jgi:hypothetical protein